MCVSCSRKKTQWMYEGSSKRKGITSRCILQGDCDRSAYLAIATASYVIKHSLVQNVQYVYCLIIHDLQSI